VTSGGGSTVIFKADYVDETSDHNLTNFAVVSQSNKYNLLLLFAEQQPLVSQDILIIEFVRSYSDTTLPPEFLFTSGQPDAETSTWLNTTVTRDKSKLPARFQPVIRATEGPENHAIDRAVTGFNNEDYMETK
jgi:hypothetical protein